MIPATALYRHLVDDAAMFPPKQADLETAFRDHLVNRNAPYRQFLGPFLVPSARTPDLLTVLDTARPQPPVRIGIIGTVDPEDAIDSIRLLDEHVGAEVAHIELPLDTGADPRDAFAAAAVVCTAPHREDPRRLICEVPHGWLDDERMYAAAVAARTAGAALKLRTGGTTPSAFPTISQVARFISAGASHGLAFKCTAGLHRAVRNLDPSAGLVHHGFANILLATHLALDGRPESLIHSALGERESAALCADLTSLDARQIGATRQAFLSFGSCDIVTPATDIDCLIRWGQKTMLSHEAI